VVALVITLNVEGFRCYRTR